MDILPITTHLSDALGRLLQQYKEQPNIQAVITGLMTEMQPLEQVFNDLGNNRWLFTAQGNQLDRLGIILGVARLTLTDDQYRNLLQARVYQTIADGDAETMIQVFKLITNGTLVAYQEYYPAGVGLESDGAVETGQETAFYKFIQSVSPAGVRVEYLSLFDPTESFAFAGEAGSPSVGALGFASDTTETDGGKFAKTLINNIPFSFSGGNPGDLGFGDVSDTLLGGTFQG